ncbi:daunorubicin resistance protein DrrC [Clostridium botulinum A2B3 87]|uniref:ATP-binding cassette domain-containing protein n=1 Tax=Clostridium botulinum TaxID=1491 RepID=UPI0004A58848|nr:excinuclease ABC subunit UvrA [Clostridium botulinum]KEI98766.1 daunorubicin resistance protein DrrC [Clostridium botulinum A2B3 87]
MLTENKDYDYIKIIGAKENNLKNVNIDIPKNKIVVFTGVSGSGKSSLVFDTLAAESQRQINETFSSYIRHSMPHYGQPNVEAITNLNVAIIVDQKRIGGNSRSTVGTITDIYTLLRLLFSRIGKPFVGYSSAFSFNNVEGMCPKCGGLGYIDDIKIDRLINWDLSLNEGAIQFPTFKPGEYRWKKYAYSGFFDNNKKLKFYTAREKELLLYSEQIKVENPLPQWYEDSPYEGIVPRFRKTYLVKDAKITKKIKEAMDNIITKSVCLECKGQRLKKEILSCKINDYSIADCSELEIIELLRSLKDIKNDKVSAVLVELIFRLEQLVNLGLGYLHLNRQTSSLSGGEAQRVKLVKHLGSSLNNLIFIMDEPSTGLHAYDIEKIKELFILLKEKQNTIMLVEHDPDIIKMGDHIIDMGKGAGKYGGNVIYQGDYEGLKKSSTITGEFLKKVPNLKNSVREPKGFYEINDANIFNLKNVSVSIPSNVITAVTGVAGSGKSTLLKHVFLEKYPDTIMIDQKQISISNRSNPATYMDISDKIRNLFSKKNDVDRSLFSFNSEGACPNCNGLGKVYIDLAFLETAVVTCEVCQGKRFKDEVLRYLYNGKNIHEIFEMTIQEASEFFKDERQIVSNLKCLERVGLNYLTLGQPLSTLSGGELQRLKLAKELKKSGKIFVFDEPTTGLHGADIKKIVGLFNDLVSCGNTVIVIEHNFEVIIESDWIIDMGPKGGKDGGRVIFEGRPQDILNYQESLTGKYLKEYLKGN